MKKISALIIGAILLTSVIFTGCSAADTTKTDSVHTVEETKNSQTNEAADESAEAVTEGGGTSVSIPTDNRKIIRNADIDMKSDDFDKSFSDILAAVKKSDGYISASSAGGGQDLSPKYSSLTCRIPADKYDSFMELLSGTGKILSKDESTQDVTADYIDVEAKIKSLKAQEERLYELLDKAGSLENLIAIQNQLTEVQYQIDSNTGRLNQMKDLISYCTVNVNLTERAEAITPVEDSFGSRIGSAFQNMWNGIINGSQSLVIYFIYAIPVIVIAVVVLVIVLLSIRYSRKKKNK